MTSAPLRYRTPTPEVARLLTAEFLRAEYVDKKRCTEEIAAECGLSRQTINNHLRRHQIPLRRWGEHMRLYKTPVVTGFSTPSSDWHAYWLGFIAADGCVWAPCNRLQFEIAAKDSAHLENFRAGIETDSPVKMGKNGKHETARFFVHSAEIVQHLATWGIVTNKTAQLDFPYHMPSSLLGAFIRGYFDGDGTIFWRKRQWPEPVCRFISGSPLFLDGLQKTLNELGIQTNKRFNSQSGKTHVLPLGCKPTNLRAFAHFIYEGAEVFLPRKKAMFSPILEATR